MQIQIHRSYISTQIRFFDLPVYIPLDKLNLFALIPHQTGLLTMFVSQCMESHHHKAYALMPIYPLESSCLSSTDTFDIAVSNNKVYFVYVCVSVCLLSDCEIEACIN